MAWQTSPESQFSERQETQDTEQAGAQGQVPEVPRVPGFSEPALPHVPPIVLHTAEAAGLGTPTREYNNGEPPRKKTLMTSLDFWLIVLALCLLAGLLAILLTVRSPLNLVIMGLILAALLPFVPPILRGRKAFNSRERRAFRAWRCASGLVYTQDEQFSAVRWEQIEVIVRKTARVNDVVSTVGYLVQPNRTLPFEFVLLKEPSASEFKWASTSRFASTTISSSAGLVQATSGVIQIIGKVDLSAYARLGELIEDQVVSQHLPRVLDAYQSGVSITFGPLTVSQQGMGDGANMLPWDELAAVRVSAGAIQITQKSEGQVWFDLPLPVVPNAALLLTFLHTLRRGETEELAR